MHMQLGTQYHRKDQREISEGSKRVKEVGEVSTSSQEQTLILEHPHTIREGSDWNLLAF